MNALARDLRRQGHNTRVISFAPDPKLDFPRDLYAGMIDGGRELLSVAGAADRLHLVDCDFDMLGPWASPLKAKVQVGRIALSMQFDGALTAGHARRECSAWAGKVSRCWATRPALARALDVDFLPPYLPIERPAYRPLVQETRSRQGRTQSACFFYSGCLPLSHYPELEALIDQWEGTGTGKARVLDAAKHGVVLAERRRAHIMGNTGDSHFSRSALEAWAAGLRVVSLRQGPWQDAYAALAGGQGAPALDREGFTRALSEIELATPPDLQARAWVSKVLDPRRWWQCFAARPEAQGEGSSSPLGRTA